MTSTAVVMTSVAPAMTLVAAVGYRGYRYAQDRAKADHNLGGRGHCLNRRSSDLSRSARHTAPRL